MESDQLRSLFPDAQSSATKELAQDRRRPIKWLAVVALSLALLIAIAVPLTKAVIFPQTSRGQCLIFDPSKCISLNNEEIARIFQVETGSGVQVVESGSTRALKTGHDHALLRVDSEKVASLLSGYSHSSKNPSLKGTGIAVLEDVFTNPHNNATALVGTDERGRVVVHLSAEWDG